MSGDDKYRHRDYSKFDIMSTEALENILHMDSQLPDDVESDLETIMYVMDILAKREENEPSERFLDTQTSWENFNEEYLSSIDNDFISLDDKRIVAPDDRREFSSQGSSIKLRSIRVALVAAIIISIFFATSLMAYAFGYDVYSAIAKWTNDTFGFVSTQESSTGSAIVVPNAAAYNDLQSALDDHGVTGNFVPTWIPEHFTSWTIETQINEYLGIITASYSDNSGKELNTFYIVHNTDDGNYNTYQKDEYPIEIFVYNDIEHYIMTNLGRTSVVWLVGNIECSMIGEISQEEAEQNIISIYERQQ